VYDVAPTTEIVKLQGGFVDNPVLIAGSGRPVVFLHGLIGQEWSNYLDDLARSFRVIAPMHPGSEDPADLSLLDSFSDLVLYYDQLFDRLDLTDVDLIGHSFGGMVAAEIAVTLRARVNRLVLVDPLGLWKDEVPVADHLIVTAETRRKLFYHDLSAPEVAERLRESEDVAQRQDEFLREFGSLAATSHFIHPIPERGLRRRLHRLGARTLLVWGSEDKLVPPSYASDYLAAINDVRSIVVEGAGHYCYLERPQEVARASLEFLSGQAAVATSASVGGR
jgi:pimeloyl-ACP methyl ester carboxylesterase